MKIKPLNYYCSMIYIKRKWRHLKMFLHIYTYKSETSKVRHLVLTYCVGKGCDIGFGGDKIVKKDCDGIDYAQPYAKTGHDKVDIPCDLFKDKIPVEDNYYDYVYTSHLIEDFVDTVIILKEFIRILKNNGTLILVFPDQQKYEQYCLKEGTNTNSHHIHKNMGLDFMLQAIQQCGISYHILFKSNCEIDYNVILIVKIKKD